MTSNLTFNKETHTYKLDGKAIPSVSNIVSVLDKSDALMYWGSNMFYESMQKQMFDKGQMAYDTDSIEEMVQEAMFSWKEKRDNAASLGTLIHEYAETRRYNHEGADNLEASEKKQYKDSITAFEVWVVGKNVKILEKEKKVYHKGNIIHGEKSFAGTLDAIVEIDDKRYVIDYKTGSNIYPSHLIQIAGYIIALKEMTNEYGEEKFNGMVVHIDKKKGKVIEYIIPDEAMYHAQRLFLQCYDLYFGRQLLEESIKKRSKLK